jgi:hypothetical protein
VHAPVTLARGDFVEFCTTRDFALHATEPVLVEQYMVGQDVTGCETCGVGSTGSTMGDPSSVLVVPTSQYLARYDFVVPPTYEQNTINVVSVTGADIEIDGTRLHGAAVALARTPWSVWRLPVEPGAHSILAHDGRAFGLQVYGVARYTSYAYPGGANLEREL